MHVIYDDDGGSSNISPDAPLRLIGNGGHVFCIILMFIVFPDMGKFMKPGKVVMVLAGRYAGRKAVIVKVSSTVILISGFRLVR